MRRIVYLWLPLWAIERWRRASPDPNAAAPAEAAFALVAQGPGGRRLSALNPAAVQEGLQTGQLLAGALAAVPHLRTAPHDPAADAQALSRLARWGARFSPAVAPDRFGPSPRADAGLYLDVSGVAHLFGGEAGLLSAIASGLAGLKLTARTGLADTPGAAWALARYRPHAPIAAPGTGLEALLDLPVEALRLDPATAAALRALGLKQVRALAGLARASLARRFGPGLLGLMDAAAGAGPEPIDPVPAPPRFCAEARFPAPLVTLEAIEAHARGLAQRLGADLTAAGLGLRRGELRLTRADGACARLAIGTGRPEADPARIARLLCERLAAKAERLDFGFGIEALRLTAMRAEAPRPVQAPLDPQAARAGAAAAAETAVLERIAARLGPQAVVRLTPRARHLPERAQRAESFAAAPSAGAPFAAPAGRRPPMLLPRPEPIEALAEVPDGPPRRFVWRRVMHQVARAEGPERIAPDWRPVAGLSRDYFRVETIEGRRFWVFREGIYGRETDRPAWFVHGAFP